MLIIHDVGVNNIEACQSYSCTYTLSKQLELINLSLSND